MIVNIKSVTFCLSLGVFFGANVHAMRGLQRMSEVSRNALRAAARQRVVNAPRASFSSASYDPEEGSKVAARLQELLPQMRAKVTLDNQTDAGVKLLEDCVSARGQLVERYKALKLMEGMGLSSEHEEELGSLIKRLERDDEQLFVMRKKLVGDACESSIALNSEQGSVGKEASDKGEVSTAEIVAFSVGTVGFCVGFMLTYGRM